MNPCLVCFADVYFVNIFDRKSISGYVIEVFGNVVVWGKKRCVALSTTEVEYTALATAITEVRWLKQLLSEINISLTGPLSIYEDNQSISCSSCRISILLLRKYIFSICLVLIQQNWQGSIRLGLIFHLTSNKIIIIKYKYIIQKLKQFIY